MPGWKRRPGRAVKRGVILSEAKDLAVPSSGLLAVRITGAVIPRSVRRRVLRFAQDDDNGDSAER
jgi:hypothetical protein